LIDAFGTIGGRFIEGYLVPIRLKEFDSFMAIEYTTPERLGRYIEKLVQYSNRWLERWTMAEYKYSQQQAERLMVGHLRFTDQEEYLGLFLHFETLSEAEGMKIVVGADLLIDVSANQIIVGETMTEEDLKTISTEIAETAEELQYFWSSWKNVYGGKENVRFISGDGQVVCNLKGLTADDNYHLPVILFNDGYGCKGLSRTGEEVTALGYRYSENSFANFIHEAIHLFLVGKIITSEKNSVLYNQSIGRDFNTESEEYKDAILEEMIVVGFQVYINGVT